MEDVITETPNETILDNVKPQEESVSISSSLSEEYRDNPSLSKFNNEDGVMDINKVSKSYLELESLMGQGKVVIPKDAEDTVAWSGFDKAFNIPEKAEDYKLENELIQGDQLGSFKEAMKKNHIPESTANELLNLYVGDMQQLEQTKSEQGQADMESATTALKEEWGMKFNENMAQANKYLESVSETKEEYDYINNKVGNDPTFIKLLARMGDSVSEGSLGGFEGQGSGMTRTPQEAKAELDRIMNDPNDAYWAGSRNQRDKMAWSKENNQSYVSEVERKKRVEYVQSLMQMAG